MSDENITQILPNPSIYLIIKELLIAGVFPGGYCGHISNAIKYCDEQLDKLQVQNSPEAPADETSDEA